MKKVLLAFLLVVSMAACAPTQTMAQGGGLFQLGEKTEKVEGRGLPGLPGHGETGDQNAAPVGSGILALSLMGGAYLIGKKSKDIRK